MNMSALATSFKVWAIAVFLNAIFLGVIVVLWGDFWHLYWAFMALLVGYTAGGCFWMLMTVLIKMIMAIPYSAGARICWLACCMSGLVVLFYCLGAWICMDSFSLNDQFVQLLTGTTIAALIIALYWTRSLFRDKEDSIPFSEHS